MLNMDVGAFTQMQTKQIPEIDEVMVPPTVIKAELTLGERLKQSIQFKIYL